MGAPMKKFYVALLAGTCAACATQPPVQLGNDKYRIARPDALSQQAVQEAQAFCRNQNFDYAEITADYANATTFFCMKKGEKLSYTGSK